MAAGKNKRPREEVESPERDESEILMPASVTPDVPLLDSYTYHTQLPKAAERAREYIEREHDGDTDDAVKQEKLHGMRFMLGVDEAGRGPVLGPMVYGISFCPIDCLDLLKEIGFADSKTLTTEQRDRLLQTMTEHGDNIGWGVRVMTPHDLSAAMLRAMPYNLNAQSHDATIMLIKDVLASGVDLAQVNRIVLPRPFDQGLTIAKIFVDTVGPPATYQAKLSAIFPGIDIVVAPKADSLYPIVSAASIAAKVTRDKCMEHWKFVDYGLSLPAIPGSPTGRPGKKLKRLDSSVLARAMQDESSSASLAEETACNPILGSGYPGDPKTKAFLQASFDTVFGFPSIARFSWATVKTLMEKGGVGVVWTDEVCPGGIDKYLVDGKSGGDVRRKGTEMPAVWKRLGLVSTAGID